MRSLAITLSLALVSSGCLSFGAGEDDSVCEERMTLDGPLTGSQIEVHGRVVDARGEPVPHARIALERNKTLFELVIYASLGLATAGALCLLEDGSGISLCGSAQVRTLVADADGAWSAEVPEAQTRGALGIRLPMEATAVRSDPSAALDRGWVSARFVPNRPRIDLGPMRLWEPTVRRTAQSVEVDAVPTLECGTDVATTLGLFDPGGVLVWKQPFASGQTLEGRVFEDFATSAQITAVVDVADAGPAFEHAFGSAPTALPTLTHVPTSRGRACVVRSPWGSTLRDPCPLTDGVVAKDLGNEITSVTIDLGALVDVDLIVARGAASWSGVVEISPDASWWTPVVLEGEQFGLAQMPGNASARYLRVRELAASDRIETLGEISIW